MTDEERVATTLHAALPTANARYAALIASGLVRPPIEPGDPMADWPDATLALPAGTVAALLDEERGI